MLARAIYEEQFRAPQFKKQSLQSQRIPCDGFASILLDEVVEEDVKQKATKIWNKISTGTKDLFKSEKEKQAKLPPSEIQLRAPMAVAYQNTDCYMKIPSSSTKVRLEWNLKNNS